MALKLSKRLFGSEYVFKIEYLINVKRVEGDNITTYQGNVQHVKIILKNEPSKHVNFENGESTPPEK